MVLNLVGGKCAQTCCQHGELINLGVLWIVCEKNGKIENGPNHNLTIYPGDRAGGFAHFGCVAVPMAKMGKTDSKNIFSAEILALLGNQNDQIPPRMANMRKPF